MPWTLLRLSPRLPVIWRRVCRACAAAVVLLTLAFSGPLLAPQSSPPNTPVITTPEADGEIVNAADVHMESAPFSDPDPGDTHQCTDWEIWTVVVAERVWSAACATGAARVHIHLGDGAFENSYAGRTDLLPSVNYRLQARHIDGENNASAWAERLFTTGPLTKLFPLILDDVLDAPTWNDLDGQPILLPDSAGGGLRLESAAGATLLDISGHEDGNKIFNPPALPEHVALRIALSGGAAGLVLPETDLEIVVDGGGVVLLDLPATSLPPNESLLLWVSRNGATYYAEASQTEPDFSNLARGPAVPWNVLQPGYRVEVVATGFQLPVNMVFVPSPGPNPHDPLYYVSELYGNIKVVTRDGAVSDYAAGLLNFNPTGVFPGSGETGLTGILVEPATGDVYASLMYASVPFSDTAPHYPEVIRLQSMDGGHTALTQTVVLDMVGETQGPSHQISNITIGPDGKLYVHMGDGFETAKAQDPDSFRGKVLRLNLDGTPATDNTGYDPGDGITARDYIYALGVRNPFGGAWRASDGQHFIAENGPGHNDRLSRLIQDANYGWDGTSASMTTLAIYNWYTITAPVNLAVIQPVTFGGSGFPASKFDHLFVTESGGTAVSGPDEYGKRISEFVVDSTGILVSGPTPLIEYAGSGRATAAALAAGPDGLYFSELYKDVSTGSPIQPGANILRIRYVGSADFDASPTAGSSPLTVSFTDTSFIISPTTWLWDFGDGAGSNLPSPTHIYTAAGVYDVSLRVNGAAASDRVVRPRLVRVDTAFGLLGEYYTPAAGLSSLDNLGAPSGGPLGTLALVRIDAGVDFDWGGAPDPALPSGPFLARWSGELQPTAGGAYTLTVVSSGGARLWIDGSLLIDHWTPHALASDSATATFAANSSHALQLDFASGQQPPEMHLRWSRTGQPAEIIPSQYLFAAADLQLGLSSGAAAFVPNVPVTVTFAVHNLGPALVPSVSLAMTLPTGATLLNTSPPNCASAAGVLSCQLGTLAARQTVSATASFTLAGLTEPGAVTASVSSSLVEANDADNHQSLNLLLPWRNWLPLIGVAN